MQAIIGSTLNYSDHLHDNRTPSLDRLLSVVDVLENALCDMCVYTFTSVIELQSWTHLMPLLDGICWQEPLSTNNDALKRAIASIELVRINQ